MKRLLEEDYGVDSPEQALANLVRATPRLNPGPFRTQRILVAVKGGGAKGRRRVRRAAIATAAAILAGAAIAAAAVEHFRAPNTPVVAPTPIPSAIAQPILPAPSPEAPVDLTRTDPPAPQDVPTPRPPPSRAPSQAGATIERPSARLPTTAQEGEDPTPVLEAIRALRNNGDPSRAGVLLAQYLKTHPHGVLSEDASALSIEAAIARHDPKAAAELGRRYLARFPNGRYRSFAVQSVETPAP